MNVKAITLVMFFAAILLYLQIKFITRLRILRKTRDCNIDNGFVMAAFDLCGCCFGCFECLQCLSCCGEGVNCLSEGKIRKEPDENEVYRQKQHQQVEKQKQEQQKIDAFEERNKENREKEQKEYFARIEQEKKTSLEKAKKLRENGFTPSKENRNKVLETVSIKPETNLSWTSASTRIPIEEIIIIIEDEPGYEIKDEYILNKNKIEAKVNVCPNCKNLIKTNDSYCSNCGESLK